MTARHHRTRQRASTDPGRWGRRLGWLSIGLGTLHLAAPGLVRRVGGVDDSAASRTVVRLIGARELVHGAGLLFGRNTRGWVWSRVGGDALDLASLGVALARRRGIRRARLMGATGAVLAMTAVDVATAVRAGRSRARRLMELTGTTTIRRPRSDVYAFWRRLENLPRFMTHLDEVEEIDARHSRWRATAPFGRTVSWDAEIIQDIPDTRIAWRSAGDAAVRNLGTVTFTSAPDGVSTEVRVRIAYDLPGGRLGAAVAKFFGEEPHQQVADDLRRLKQALETGDVVRSEGALWGERARKEFPQRPAKPPRADELVRGADELVRAANELVRGGLA
ncbi:MAG: SRPBCC family protein [Micromonosporaceae bacterium]|nr:SRPBCC family protein [Micromonosporaceae bacterium]